MNKVIENITLYVVCVDSKFDLVVETAKAAVLYGLDLRGMDYRVQIIEVNASHDAAWNAVNEMEDAQSPFYRPLIKSLNNRGVNTGHHSVKSLTRLILEDRSMRTPSVRAAMPDWNGHESIVAYSIRKRNERARRAHLARMLTLATFTPVILAGIVTITAILCDYFLNTY